MVLVDSHFPLLLQYLSVVMQSVSFSHQSNPTHFFPITLRPLLQEHLPFLHSKLVSLAVHCNCASQGSRMLRTGRQERVLLLGRPEQTSDEWQSLVVRHNLALFFVD